MIEKIMIATIIGKKNTNKIAGKNTIYAKNIALHKSERYEKTITP